MDTCFILGIDQGTTNSKAAFIDSHGEVLRASSKPVQVTFPQPGWVEQDPFDLWNSAREAAAEVLEGIEPAKLVAVAVTNQRESTLIWERATGQPLGPCVTWQCQRSADLCAGLRQSGLSEVIKQKTGLELGPMFSAGKARWLLDHIPDGIRRAKDGELCFGTVDAWMLWKLTNGQVHACDVTNASRTQLFNLDTLDWDKSLLDVFGLPHPMLPQVKPSAAQYGETCAVEGIPNGIQVAALIGDSHAALFGQAGFHPGSIKVTYGTGSSLMMPIASPARSQVGLSTTVAWGCPEVSYALEGNIYATGAAVSWLQEFLGLASPDQVEALASQTPDNGQLYFVPALAGLGAPYWDERARGLLTGITRGTTAAHAARATIEAIAYQIQDVFTAMQGESVVPLNVLLADGGATRNEVLMQFQADILNIPVIRSRVSDLALLGAVYLAGLSVGIWQNLEEVAALPRPHDRFEPSMEAKQRDTLLAGWREAVSRARSKDR